MQQYGTVSAHQGEGRLWLISALVALVLLLLTLFAAALLAMSSLAVVHKLPQAAKTESQVVIMLVPKIEKTTNPAATPATSPKRTFARTSQDQQSGPPKRADFIGDRDTTAASDRVTVAGAPNLPNQAGREPRRPDEVETTESMAQEGELAHDAIAKPASEPNQQAAPAVAAVTPRDRAQAAAEIPENMPPPIDAANPLEKDQSALTPPPPPMALGDQEVERATLRDLIKPKEKTPPQMVQEQPQAEPQKSPSVPKPKAAAAAEVDPGFRGNQEKTKLSGSLSRQGRSALNVANTAMGRYHAQLSRAVEAEWHRNCTKYRDFITPGILTMRFVVDEKGAVRSVSVVEMIDAGEVQKGFTLNSIRQAKIPPIPADLKKELDGEPLELIYNFYF